MPPILSLYILLFFATLSHLAMVVYNSIKFYMPSKSLRNTEYNYTKFDPANNRLRLGLSLTFFLGPIIITLVLRSFQFEDELSIIAILAILIMITIYFTYFNHYKIWSEKFRTVPNPKIISEQSYSEHQRDLKIELDKIKENEKEVQKKYNITTTSVNSLSFELDQVKTKVSTNAEKSLAKQNKPLSEYFKTKEQFRKFETLLYSNDFWNSKEHITATKLCILTCKLIDLKVLYIYRKQKYFLPALARHFEVEEFDESTFSRIQKEFKEYKNGELIDEAHREFYEKLSYLDSLK
ncbi:hypothetical protein G3I01_08860 [Gramella sp. MT6]|uniref:hypothetical protein n=1 Tax=Gramella sp. MT6 TaxID=2705471 RepID=UPI001C5DF358|nr:hypothetical protein [Gramella sp. MT6]QYA25617.1 hypothetical protein G3I01_08860 [Gramella sp. MT6]